MLLMTHHGTLPPKPCPDRLVEELAGRWALTSIPGQDGA